MDTSEYPPAVDLRNITMTFRGHVTAVDDVSLRVNQGEVVALLGPNGAGKTTLIDTALALQRPTTGEAQLLGMGPEDAKRRGLVGVVNQTGALPADYKVAQLLEMFRGFYEAPLAIDEVIALAHLESLESRRIGKLSGGEQQRLRLALALVPDPMILFLDEPTAGMDPTARQEFWRVMERATVNGKTIIFATHYLAEVESFAKRTVIMRDGKVVADAATSDLLRQGLGELTIQIPSDSYEDIRDDLTRPGWECSWSSGTLTMHGRDLDDAARILLKAEGARNLRITDSSLEDIFTEFASETAVLPQPQPAGSDAR
ncbi:ABC transporter ATP-binding protein [Actinomycetaceae bacterium MB13-C1-2]|nr:ABC transporter ATP-binding protein [Actinomycetaceae bacterium MB13-C1-2]